MNPVQERAILLLKELDEICENSGLKYCLAEKTLYQAMKTQKFDADSYIVDVLMPASDAARLVKAVDFGKYKDREIESWENNPDMPGLYLRYVDSSTTFIDTSHEPRYKKLGVFIQIRVMRSVNPDRAGRYEERILEDMNVEKRFTVSESKPLKMKWAVKLLGKGRTARQIYKKQIAAAPENPGSLYYKAPRGKRQAFPADFFDKLDRGVFEGIEVSVPADPAAYFTKRHGKNWDSKLKKYREKQVKYETIFDLDMPYAEFLRRSSEKGVDFDTLIRTRCDCIMWQKDHVEPLEKKISAEMLLIRRTADRIRLWEKYYPMKDDLIHLREEENWDELGKKLAENITCIEKWQGNKMGFCFDNTIFDITCDVLQHRGRDEYVKKIRALVPAEHKQDLDEFMKEEGIDISYLEKQ